MDAHHQPGTAWDPHGYARTAGFVTRAGDSLLDWLDAQPGERVLDLGCGGGEHVAALCARGVLAEGVDNSPAMIEAARTSHPQLRFTCADARALPWQAAFDAVVSNACLHWIPEAEAACASIAGVLRPGGRLVLDMGGQGNVAAVISAVDRALAEHGLARPWQTWYFPSPATYAAVLERSGFTVRELRLFPRPSTVPADGGGLQGWLAVFASGLITGLGERRAEVLAAIERHARGALWRDGAWTVDYVRLRAWAVRT